MNVLGLDETIAQMVVAPSYNVDQPEICMNLHCIITVIHYALC